MSLKNILLTCVGFLLLFLGAIGVFLPVLPTTPFVLAAFSCFAGNPEMRAWLLKNSFFSDYLTNYKNRTGLKKSTVVLSLSSLWIMLCISMFIVSKLWYAVLLICIGLAVTIHILYISKPLGNSKS